MAIPAIQLDNQTGSPITLVQLGVTVPASGSVTITGQDGDVYVIEVCEDRELHAQVSGGSITLTVDAVALTQGQSIAYLNPHDNLEAVKHNLSATTDPSGSDDETAGYSIGSQWINTSSDAPYVCVDATTSSAVWVGTTGGGDVTGPASSTDNAIARYDGTTGKVIQNSSATVDDDGNIDNVQGEYNGVRHYNNSATDPAVPAPAEGDRYYNTTLEMEMRYDGSRGKWLSVAEATFTAGDFGNLPVGGYMIGAGGVRMSAIRGYTAPYNGTVVSLGWTRDDTDSTDFAVAANGTTVATATSAAITGYDNTLNGNFSQGNVLAVRNDGAGTPNDATVNFRVRWRA